MSFCLIIEKLNKGFSPGQTICGRVFCSLTEPQVIEVKVRPTGVECTRTPEQASIIKWEDYRNTKDDRTIEFLQTRCIDIQSGTVSAGEHNFLFKLTLPSGIPSSYQGKHGYVKYFIEVYLTTNFTQIKRGKAEIEVLSPIILTDVPNASLVPSVEFDEVVTRKWFCVPEAIRMEVELKKNAFVLGEVGNVHVILKNFSCLHILSVTTKLYLITYARVSTPTDRWQVDGQVLLSSEKKRGVRSYEIKTDTFQLKIPIHRGITNFQKCKLFTQKAVLEVTAVFENFDARNLQVRVDLVLGHHFSDGQIVALGEIEDPTESPPPAYETVCDLVPDTLQSFALFNSTTDLRYPITNLKPTAPPKSSDTALYPLRTPRPTPRYDKAPPIRSLPDGSPTTCGCFEYVDSSSYGDPQDSYQPQESCYQSDFVSEPAAWSDAVCYSDSPCDNVCVGGGGGDSGGGGGDSGGGGYDAGGGDGGGCCDGGGGGDGGGSCD